MKKKQIAKKTPTGSEIRRRIEKELNSAEVKDVLIALDAMKLSKIAKTYPFGLQNRACRGYIKIG